MDYNEAWNIQKQIHEKVAKQAIGPVAILVEHPPVLTLGKHADKSNIFVPMELLELEGVQIVQIDRGGEVTAHVPGQLVVYPIVHLPSLALGPRSYICSIESSIIDTLAEFGIQSSRHPQHPGVWVKDEKIAAVGVRIKNRTTMHGLSLNINNKFDLFSKILPCGIKGLGVTSMELQLKKDISTDEIKISICKSLTKCLDIGDYQIGELSSLI